MTSVDRIIALARRLGVAPAAIKQWRRRGVPRLWWYDLAEAAAAAGQPLSRAELAAFPEAPADPQPCARAA